MGFINALPGAIALGLVWGVMAIGVFITFKLLDFADLTVDGSFATGGIVGAVLIVSDVNPWVALLVAFFAGTITGLITGLFHTLFGIPAILSGILTQLMLYSINLKIGGKANISVPSRTYKTVISSMNLRGGALFNNPIFILVIFIAIIIGIMYWFFGTEVGCSIRATGCNPNMSKAQGININYTKIIALMISNGLVALSGALLAQYQGFADISMGRGSIVIALAAIIIGGALLNIVPKKYNQNFALKLTFAAIGSVVYYIVYQLVVYLGIDTELLKMLSAIVVALFLAIPFWKGKIATMHLFNKRSYGAKVNKAMEVQK